MMGSQTISTRGLLVPLRSTARSACKFTPRFYAAVRVQGETLYVYHFNHVRLCTAVQLYNHQLYIVLGMVLGKVLQKSRSSIGPAVEAHIW